MKKNKAFQVAGIAAAAFVLLIVLLKLVDVAAIGPMGSEVGFSHLNAGVHKLFGEHEVIYKISGILGYIAIAAGLAFAAFGVYQLIMRKSLFKVDKCILTLGGLYVILGIFYVLFDKIVINMRPMIVWGETLLEPSFPSSHTMLSCTIMGSIVMILDRYIKDKKLCYWLKIACLALAVLVVLTRLISGVHWFTDILGGIIFSVMLLALFKGVTLMVEKRGKHGE